MRRTVTTHLTADLSGSATVLLSIAAAADYDRKSESLQVSIDDERVEPAEIAGPH